MTATGVAADRELGCLVVALGCLVMVLALAATPAVADHTDPRVPLVDLGAGVRDGAALSRGLGTWAHLGNLPPNSGSDLDVFTGADGATYAAFGTLGQSAAGRVGQRLARLLDAGGAPALAWLADHGSAACPAVTVEDNFRMQHDAAVTPQHDPALLLDTTDDLGRCHDPQGGGLELIDVSGIGGAGFLPREVHLTRHNGTAHTVTVDPERPWVVYVSNGEYTPQPWIDVLDVRSCMAGDGPDATVEARRAACRPPVFRIPLQDEWTSRRAQDGTLTEPTSCHDVHVEGGRLYCAALNATVVLDVGALTGPDGAIAGTPLPCTLRPGTLTTAQVTDCVRGGFGADEARAAWDAAGRPQATGWSFVTSIHHPGRDDGEGGTTGLTNVVVPASQEVAIAHEAEPVPPEVGPYVLVTDERGGGLLPPGASCGEGLDNPSGNGGIHAYDLSDPANPVHALAPDGSPAVFQLPAVVPAETFCTVHVIENLPDERRILAAWYTQGIALVDYAVDPAGRITFTETASLTLDGASTWAASVAAVTDHGDGTATYTIATNDLERGADLVAWTGPRNLVRPPTPPPTTAPPATVPPTAASPSTVPPTAASTSATTPMAAADPIPGRPATAAPEGRPTGFLGNILLGCAGLVLLAGALVLRARRAR